MTNISKCIVVYAQCAANFVYQKLKAAALSHVKFPVFMHLFHVPPFLPLMNIMKMVDN